jgi:hypothetical protein
MINTARDELRDALAKRETAESALESARQASARGRVWRAKAPSLQTP